MPEPIPPSLPPTFETGPLVEPSTPIAEPDDPFALTPDERNKWKTRIAKALEAQAVYHPWWELSLKNYAPSVRENPNPNTLPVRTNRSFTIVERKQADLFYQKPDVQVSPSPLLETVPNNAAMAAAHATIINAKLGLNGANAKKLAQQAIFDYELFGVGPTKVFYRAYTQDVTRPVTDPVTGEPLMDFAGQPVTETIPVPVKTKCGWENFSPKQLMIPADFRSTDFDENAPWLGMRFTMSTHEARSIWKEKIPNDFTSSGSAANQSGKSTSQFFDQSGQSDASREPTNDSVTGTELYYRSMLFRPDVAHPDRMTKLVMIDGIDEPVEHRDSPDQTVITPEWVAEDPQRSIFQSRMGDLTPDSLIGFPFAPMILRVLTDSAYVMSDVAIALPQTQELDKYRAQGVRQRDINLLKYLYDATKLPKDTLEKMISSDMGGIVEAPTEVMQDIDRSFVALKSVPIPPDNYAMAAALDHDLDQTFGIDATAAGTNASGSQTATETNIRQANVNVRLGKEQGFVADWWIIGVTKFSTLIQRYMTVEQAAEIVGHEQAMAWDQWRRMIPTRLAFTMTPDSSLKNDTPLERLQLQQLFTYLANDPSINRPYFLTKILEKFHLDPARAVIPPDQIPPPKKEEPKISISVDTKSLSPLAPESPIVLDMLMKAGMQIDPTALTMAIELGHKAAQAVMMKSAIEAQGQGEKPDTEHGGKLKQIEGLDKHLADLTGAQSKTGEPLPGMSGNAIQ